jgi:hypothetical protein
MYHWNVAHGFQLTCTLALHEECIPSVQLKYPFNCAQLHEPCLAYETFMAGCFKKMVFLGLMPCSAIEMFQPFRGMHCLHLRVRE